MAPKMRLAGIKLYIKKKNKRMINFSSINLLKCLFFILLIVSGINKAVAQTEPLPIASQAPEPPKNTKALKFNLNESGSQYFQVTFLNQIWLRYNQSNPGTLVQGDPKSETFDIGLRRTRIQMFGQISERAFLYFQFGQNNFNAMYNSNGGNRKIAPFFHDALGEYRVTNNNALKLGAGLTVASGISRFTQPSVGTILTLDVPVFAQATVDQIDQFNRKLSVYARGQVSKLDYRLVVSDPFPITSSGAAAQPLGPNATFVRKGHHKQFQAYLAYNFFEMEGHTTPYMAGSYLGSKKVFNIGAGFASQKNATWTGNAAGDTLYHDMFLWSAEAFLDSPLNRESGTAISAYAGYFNYDFGPNYLRFNGLMNPANGSAAANSVSSAGATFGNAVPMFGTGTIQYAQVGYLLPRKILGETNGLLQPYLAYTRSDFDRLGTGNAATLYDIGANWLINGNNAKLTLNYQNRPVFSENSDGVINKGGRKNALILQYQVNI